VGDLKLAVSAKEEEESLLRIELEEVKKKEEELLH